MSSESHGLPLISAAWGWLMHLFNCWLEEGHGVTVRAPLPREPDVPLLQHSTTDGCSAETRASLPTTGKGLVQGWPHTEGQEEAAQSPLQGFLVPYYPDHLSST